MIERDRNSVIEIDSLCYSRRLAIAEIDRILSKHNCIGMVAEQGDRVVGFMIYHVYDVSYDIRNLAVDPDLWRLGIGSQLVERLITKLYRNDRKYISTTVRETALDAQLFLKAQGFLARKVLREAYEDTGEAGYYMKCTRESRGAVKNELLF